MEKAFQSFTFSQNFTHLRHLTLSLESEEEQLPRRPHPQGLQPFDTGGVARVWRLMVRL